MTLRPGSHAAFGDSLGEAIASAFAGELWALRAATLPSVGKEDRELLFAAIGQGVLQYLARRQDDVTVTVPFGLLSDKTVPVDVDVATLTRTPPDLVGARFAPGSPVTIRELTHGAVVATVSVNGAGGFSLPLGGLGGPVVLDARDAAGNAAQTVLP